MQIHRLDPEDLSYLASEYSPFPQTCDKYLLVASGEQLQLLLAPEKIDHPKKKYIYHKDMLLTMEHCGHWGRNLRPLGGGSIDCWDNTLQIHDFSGSYGHAPQKILDEIKEDVLRFYQNLFLHLNITGVIARDGRKNED